MHAKALLITALAAFATLATAAPAPSLEARDKYVAAAIFFYIHIPGMTPFEEPSPIEVRPSPLEESDPKAVSLT